MTDLRENTGHVPPAAGPVVAAAAAACGATIIDLAQWRTARRPPPRTGFVAPQPDDDAVVDVEHFFPPPGATKAVKEAWAEAVTGLGDYERRVAAAVFLSETNAINLTTPCWTDDHGYRHLITRLLYRDELVWRRHYGDYHAFARWIVIRFAKSLARRSVA